MRSWTVEGETALVSGRAERKVKLQDLALLEVQATPSPEPGMTLTDGQPYAAGTPHPTVSVPLSCLHCHPLAPHRFHAEQPTVIGPAKKTKAVEAQPPATSASGPRRRRM